ncbi:TetR/AcrR family transcriptional regulator [Actinokineospora enzanensis]|uniref:TetR/AcrR family transcriptional regulator n=1 Tax=Actinokineospora enzanensis TaxID=155975 RepID=UPI0003778D7F|nr:TetR/AcrR family transcriptional regulator [Actinokineospora enzanensis]
MLDAVTVVNREEPDVTQAMALLWDPPDGPRRGPRPTLAVRSVAAAGIAIADADGLAAVTMQRVAAAVGVTKMAIYRYVPGKDDLVAVMVDLAVGPPPELPDGWRAALDHWARTLFDRFRAHPWALAATIGPRPIGPNEVAWLDRAVAALAGTGLRGGEAIDVAATLAGHVRGIAQQGVAVPDGSPEGTMAATVGAVLAARADRFPALAAAMRSAAEDGAHDQALDFGLARILDGVAAFVSTR